MRNVLSTLLLLGLVPACKSERPRVAQAATLASRSVGNSARTIVTPAGKEWTQPGGDYAGSRSSSLTQITPANSGELRVVTTFATGVLQGHEGNPLVVDNTMYVVTPWPNILYALDLTRPGGALKWVYKPMPSDRAVGIACCDIVNRGATYANGRIYYNTLDAQTVAVDARSGKQAWK